MKTEEYDPRYSDFVREIYEREDKEEMARLNPDIIMEDEDKLE